jgi:2-(1,2-epoxy-1,2-dihydrophenyl)acetyl-CoA isomerase
MARDLLDAARRCDGNPEVRAVLLTGKGRFFSGGGDVQSFAAAEDDAAGLLNRITGPLHAAIASFARMNAPLVTAINGTAAGAGFSLAISGDIVVAAESAKLTLAYTRIGMSADGGASHMLPQIVGLTRAKELMLLNPLLTATEAEQLGLVTLVVPDADLAAKANEIAKAAASVRGIGDVKIDRILGQQSHHRRPVTAVQRIVEGRHGRLGFARRSGLLAGLDRARQQTEAQQQAERTSPRHA